MKTSECRSVVRNELQRSLGSSNYHQTIRIQVRVRKNDNPKQSVKPKALVEENHHRPLSVEDFNSLPVIRSSTPLFQSQSNTSFDSEFRLERFVCNSCRFSKEKESDDTEKNFAFSDYITNISESNTRRSAKSTKEKSQKSVHSSVKSKSKYSQNSSTPLETCRCPDCCNENFSEKLDETDASQKFLESSSKSDVLSVCSTDSVPTISKAAKFKDGKIHSFKALYFDARMENMTPREMWDQSPVRTPESSDSIKSKASVENRSCDNKPSSKSKTKSSCETCTSKSIKSRSNAKSERRKKWEDTRTTQSNDTFSNSMSSFSSGTSKSEQ